VVWSLSKPFGVYYHCIGGLIARAEIPTLRGHHWFKNLFSVQLGERLMAAHPAGELPARYRDRQHEALERTRAAGLVAADARPSDVVMLAHASWTPPPRATSWPTSPRGECVGMRAPPLGADRAPVATLYRRLIEVESEPLGSPKASIALAAIEREARALGDRELEARAAVRLGMCQIETDQLAAAARRRYLPAEAR
jgi:hypothetical protein